MDGSLKIQLLSQVHLCLRHFLSQIDRRTHVGLIHIFKDELKVKLVMSPIYIHSWGPQSGRACTALQAEVALRMNELKKAPTAFR